ncbi:LruC domain-containing protein [Bacteroides sp. OttesenSCG-928-D19]|nr:LruC domain-containing protein [Bacteroides sp. OttesenSCG-928-N06]MDL2305979.1 LruC domain-containing protein [Bacteroides sp. OttesenSCG-928-D19]
MRKKRMYLEPILKSNIIINALFLIISVMAFSSCEKDYYDPNFQTENPLTGIEAPDGFNWQTTRSLSVTVDVNDEMSGAYYYGVEVFQDNPLVNPQANILAKGVANKDLKFSAGITITPDVETVYIRQTDPRGRSRVVATSAETNINYAFAPNFLAETRAATTRADVSVPSYSVNSPEYVNATEWNNSNFGSNTNYKISVGAKVSGGKGITIGGAQNSKLFVAGTLEISNTISIGSGVELIVLDGGKVIATEFSSKNGTADVIIMPGGTMTITGSKGATIGDTNAFYNFGTLNVTSGTLEAQNGGGSIFYNGSDGVINAKDMQIHNDKTYIENHGVISVETISKGGGAATIYNLCVMQATKSMDFSDIGELFMDGGMIISPSITLKSTTVTLRNGAMFKCDNLNTSGNSVFTGTGSGNRSLVKVQNIGGGAIVVVSGHVTIENDNSSAFIDTQNGADMASYNDTNIVIEGCKAEGNSGNEGGDAESPEFPIVTPVAGKYTFLFEDFWPVYGDYDMNDVVFKVDNIKVALNERNMAEKFSFDLTLLATGAQKRIGGALMLDLVAARDVQSVSYSSVKPKDFMVTSAGVEEGQSKAVIPLFDNIHSAFGKPNAWHINTIDEGIGTQDNADPVLITIEISFAQPQLAIDLNVNYLNFFIITEVNKVSVSRNERKEIHLVGFAPTDKADTSVFGNHNDNSYSSYYLSKDNLAWGISVPDDFKWLSENSNINEGYLDFIGWVTSGGTANKTWWKSNYDVEKLFNP